jgi:hypothetical protein
MTIGAFQGFVIEKPTTVDVVSANGIAMIGTGYPKRLNNKWVIEPFLYLTSMRYNMDGMFSKTDRVYSFDVTPDNYKQSYLSLYSIKLPVLFKYDLFDLHNGVRKGNASVGLGPYAEYFFHNVQRYKIADKNYREKASIENQFNYGLAAEVTVASGPKATSEFYSFSFGLSYQMSEYLKSSPSFKTLILYIRLGIGTMEERD